MTSYGVDSKSAFQLVAVSQNCIPEVERALLSSLLQIGRLRPWYSLWIAYSIELGPRKYSSRIWNEMMVTGSLIKAFWNDYCWRFVLHPSVSTRRSQWCIHEELPPFDDTFLQFSFCSTNLIYLLKRMWSREQFSWRVTAQVLGIGQPPKRNAHSGFHQVYLEALVNQKGVKATRIF